MIYYVKQIFKFKLPMINAILNDFEDSMFGLSTTTDLEF